MAAAVAGGSQAEMTKVLNKCINCLKFEMNARDSQGKPKYTDVCEWLSDKLATPGDRAHHKTALEDLLDECKNLTNAEVTSTFQDSVPSQTQTVEAGVEHLEKFALRLWQMGVHEASHVKGAPALHSCLDNLQKILIGHGGETHKYPLEVLFEWQSPWSVKGKLMDFTLGISIGSAVTMASHLLCWAVVKLDLLNSSELTDPVKTELASRLLTAICTLTCFHI